MNLPRAVYGGKAVLITRYIICPCWKERCSSCSGQFDAANWKKKKIKKTKKSENSGNIFKYQ